ncbi:MAG: HAD hydrolase-like protein [Candidatus Chisholmbacteria bacterium]|nr:HAD hydrolase-like protein [Candidatus Chisholmbacteria bacterium]
MAIDFQGVKLTIFDLDDTLIDNREVDYQSFAQVWRKYKVRPLGRKKLATYRNQGMKADDIIQRVWGNRSLSIVERVKKERQELLASGNLWLKLARPFPGVANLLNNLKKQKIRVAIVTIRKNRALIEQLLRKRGWLRRIDFLFCGDDMSDSGGTKTHASNVLKLKKAGYEKAMTFLNVAREKTLVVGDDPEDLQAALNLGIICARVRNSYKDSLFEGDDDQIPVVRRVADLRITN